MINLSRELLCESTEIIKLFRPNCVVVYPQEDAVWVLYRVKAEQKLAKFKSRPITPFATQYVNVLNQTLSECPVERLLAFRVEIEACLQLESIQGVPVACGFNRGYKLEFVAKCGLECEHAPL